MSVQYLILVFVGNANFTTNMCRIDVLWSLSISEVTENVGTSSASLTGFFKILAHLLGIMHLIHHISQELLNIVQLLGFFDHNTG